MKGRRMDRKWSAFAGGILLTGVGLAVCGCAAVDPAKDHEQVSGRETMASEVLQTNESLSFSVPEPYYSLYEPLVREYRQLYPDVEVNFSTYPYETREAVDQQRKQRATELMAGEGNDLYIMAEIEFYDIQKVKQSGAFEELSPYFENDPEMDRNLFLDGIFEMEEDGTCHILPYTISAGFLGTTEEILDSEGISLQDCETYGEQIACMVQYHRQHADRAAVAPRGSFYSALNDLGFAPWESEENDQILSSEILKNVEMLNKEEEVYKETVDQIYTDERERFFTERQNLCVNSFNFPDFEMLCLLGGAEGGILVPKMSAEAGRMRADSLYTAAISTSSPNKENAWNFIKLLLGESYQNQLLGGLPVRKDSLELWFEKQYEEFGKDAVLVDGVSCPGVSREQVDAAKEAVLHARLYFPIGYEISKNYSEAMRPYYEGEKTVDACVEEFRDYLEIYYSE